MQQIIDVLHDDNGLRLELAHVLDVVDQDMLAGIPLPAHVVKFDIRKPVLVPQDRLNHGWPVALQRVLELCC